MFIHLLQLRLVSFSLLILMFFAPPGCERVLRYQVHAYFPVLQKWKQGERFITRVYDPRVSARLTLCSGPRLRSVNLGRSCVLPVRWTSSPALIRKH